MAKLRRLRSEGSPTDCGRNDWESLTTGSRANALGWKDDRYSCHRTKKAAVSAFQKRCKPGSTGLVAKGGMYFPGDRIKCKR